MDDKYGGLGWSGVGGGRRLDKWSVLWLKFVDSCVTCFVFGFCGLYGGRDRVGLGLRTGDGGTLPERDGQLVQW